MSTTTHHLSNPQAPWKTLFEKDISKLPSPEFVLGTVHAAPAGSSVPYVPRTRVCVYRGMWGELPENKHNKAPRNGKVYASELPTFTTDVRMDKVADLFATGPGKGDESQSQGSGGGGPIEAVWWVKDVRAQWRVKGTAWVVGPDIDQDDTSSGARTVKSEIGARMRVIQEGEEGNWSWGKELTAHFGNCTPEMRGMWRNPPPGTRVGGELQAEHRLGQTVEDLEDKLARTNFRVVVIRPEVVERLDLADLTHARRLRHTLVGVEEGEQVVGKWIEEELWP